MLSAAEIQADYLLPTGILRSTPTVDFHFWYKSIQYRVNIQQNVIRRITIACDEISEQDDLIKVLQVVEHIIMLFEGRFLKLYKVEYYGDTSKIPEEYINNVVDKRPVYYSSSAICLYPCMSLIDYQKLDIYDLMPKWCEIRTELRLIHPMFLYCLSNTGLPIDCKIANLIELYEPLAELIALYKQNYILPRIKNRGESKLKKRLESIINYYGRVLFQKELNENIKKYLDKFVDTRNCIMHVSTNIGKNCLNKKETVLYTAKLSLLYRRVLFDLLGVEETLYMNNLKKSTVIWDKWFGYNE